MAKEFALAFYRSTAWKKCRESYINNRIMIDGGMCEHCHNELGFIVHHTILLTPDNINNPDIALNHDKLEFVCKSCHDIEHYEEIHGTKRGCLFDENGHPLPPIEP